MNELLVSHESDGNGGEAEGGAHSKEGEQDPLHARPEDELLGQLVGRQVPKSKHHGRHEQAVDELRRHATDFVCEVWSEKRRGTKPRCTSLCRRRKRQVGRSSS